MTRAVSAEDLVLSMSDLKDKLISRDVVRSLLAFDEATLLTGDRDFPPRPFRAALALRALSRGSVWIEGADGERRRVRATSIARFGARFLADTMRRPSVLREAAAGVSLVERGERAKLGGRALGGRPVYVKTDLVFGLIAGGSVAHTAGVLNHLEGMVGTPLLLTSVPMPMINPDIEIRVVRPSGRFLETPGMPQLAYNLEFLNAVRHEAPEDVAFVYHRYSPYSYAAAAFAANVGAPFVLEYNGSEIWIGRNWGRPLAFEDLGLRIENANLRRADLVVVVSDPMADEVISRGVPACRVLVNPNGVDIGRYRPDVDGSSVRDRFGLDGKLVVGFVGTFGRWHGAEVLVEAFGRLVQRRPEMRTTTRLLMVGDGAMMAETRLAASRYRLEDVCVFTGLVDHEQGPTYLAACDVCASPHVPNSDGTPFFGSPTKLFEYMAMGRAIVASNLDQIGNVIVHGDNGWLVPPGDVDALADALKRLLGDAHLRARLGRRARSVAVERHSWSAHTARIVARLREVASECSG